MSSFEVSLNRKEHEKIKGAAQNLGMTPREYVKAVLRNCANNPKQHEITVFVVNFTVVS